MVSNAFKNTDGSWSAQPQTGDIIAIPVEELRPTQMAVGMRAVVHKRRKLENRASNKKRIEEILLRRPIPAVRGPGGELFMIDNHHFGLALWQADVEFAYARVIEDLSLLPAVLFWKHMEATGRLYPFDEDGQRVPPKNLPTWLHALRHDPFRDLAWQVREAGGFKKTAIPYCEFRWASFFRERIKTSTLKRNPDAAFDKAMKFCRSPEAAGLPGYIQLAKPAARSRLAA